MVSKDKGIDGLKQVISDSARGYAIKLAENWNVKLIEKVA